MRQDYSTDELIDHIYDLEDMIQQLQHHKYFEEDRIDDSVSNYTDNELIEEVLRRKISSYPAKGLLPYCKDICSGKVFISKKNTIDDYNKNMLLFIPFIALLDSSPKNKYSNKNTAKITTAIRIIINDITRIITTLNDSKNKEYITQYILIRTLLLFRIKEMIN